MLGDNPDDLSCLERLKEVDFAMGLLLRPAVESPRPKVIDDDQRESPQVEDDYGARDASPMPRGENAYPEDDDEEEEDEELEDTEEERRWQSPEPRHAHAAPAAAAQPMRSSPDAIPSAARSTRSAGPATLAMPNKAERDAAFKRMDYNGNGVVKSTRNPPLRVISTAFSERLRALCSSRWPRSTRRSLRSGRSLTTSKRSCETTRPPTAT